MFCSKARQSNNYAVHLSFVVIVHDLGKVPRKEQLLTERSSKYSGVVYIKKYLFAVVPNIFLGREGKMDITRSAFCFLKWIYLWSSKPALLQ